MDNTISRKLFYSLSMLFVYVYITRISGWDLFYKFRNASPSPCSRKAVSTRTVTPFLKLQHGLSKLINTSEPSYPYKGPYIHETKTLCTSATNLTLLTIILSSTQNYQKRRILRQTWTNETYYRPYGQIKTVFLLGTNEDMDVQRKIDTEFELYGDIVQGGFIDNYRNLTYKSTMGFRWATERCRNAKYVLKTDDDIVINLFKMFEDNKLSEPEDLFHVYCHRQTRQIQREANSRWFIEADKFKGLQTFPTYCGGSFVLISNKVVPYFYKSLKRTSFFWIEDVLLYGIGLANLQGLKYKQLSNKNMNLYTPYLNIICLDQHKKQCPIIVTMTTSVIQIQQIWAKIIEIYSNGDEQYGISLTHT